MTVPHFNTCLDAWDMSGLVSLELLLPDCDSPMGLPWRGDARAPSSDCTRAGTIIAGITQRIVRAIAAPHLLQEPPDMPMTPRRRLIPLCLAAAVAALPGVAQAQPAPALRMAVEAEITSTDPHFHNLAPNKAVAAHIFDALILQDEQQRLVPGLAVSWRAIDDLTWEFKLREGVTWHDGAPFTAEDVAFTITRAPAVPNSPSSLRPLHPPDRGDDGGGCAHHPLPHALGRFR